MWRFTIIVFIYLKETEIPMRDLPKKCMINMHENLAHLQQIPQESNKKVGKV